MDCNKLCENERQDVIINVCPQLGKSFAYMVIASKVIRSVNAALFARACTCGSGGRNRRVKDSRVRDKWRATIGSVRKKERRHLGYFPSAERAAKAYDAAAIEMYGEFALLNFCQ
jgi:hypothetical protein